MANRVLRDWTSSENIDAVSPGAEVFFVRLIMKADDFGRFHGNPKLLRSALFPLKNLDESIITELVAECVQAGLVTEYESEGRKYLEISNFGQRLRIMKSRFPAPGEHTAVIVRSTVSTAPLETETETESEVETETEEETPIAPVESLAAEASASIPSFSFKKALIKMGVTAGTAGQWLKVRKNKRATNTEIAFKLINAEILKSDKAAEDCIRFAVEMSWAGFQNDWMVNELKKRGPSGVPGSTAVKQTHANSGDGVDWENQK